ncbi:MAG: peroxiredoxin [Pseudomonadota bacterium]
MSDPVVLEAGDAAPHFSLPTNGSGTLTFPTGKPAVVYFYPKDDTPGCTTEGKDFSAAKDEFAALGIDIIGMSPDTAAKHDKFAAKHDLTVTLVADEEKQALEAFGVWVEKSMYGKTYMGVERSTFLVDGEGKILETWRKVRVKGHVEKVLEAARQHFG